MNMSYCEFENTFRDLQNCLNTLNDTGSIANVESNAIQHEKEYVRKLIRLCMDISKNWSDELEQLETFRKSNN